MCNCGHIDHFHDGLGCIACGCKQIPDAVDTSKELV